LLIFLSTFESINNLRIYHSIYHHSTFQSNYYLFFFYKEKTSFPLISKKYLCAYLSNCFSIYLLYLCINNYVNNSSYFQDVAIITIASNQSTLQSIYYYVLKRSNHNSGIRSLHTYAVASVINNYDDYSVNLHRSVSNIQTKLRSRFSWKLNYYRNRIEPDTPDTCPLCNNTPYDVQYIFNCPANPTNLTPLDLWKKPREAAHFLHHIKADWYWEQWLHTHTHTHVYNHSLCKYYETTFFFLLRKKILSHLYKQYCQVTQEQFKLNTKNC